MAVMTQATDKASLALLKKYGYRADIVERWVSGKRYDFCGFGDIIAFRSVACDELRTRLGAIDFSFDGTLCVQTCSRGSVNAHVEKVTEGRPRHALMDWLECKGNRFEVWGWTGGGLARVQRVSLCGGEFFAFDNSELAVFGFDVPN